MLHRAYRRSAENGITCTNGAENERFLSIVGTDENANQLRKITVLLKTSINMIGLRRIAIAVHCTVLWLTPNGVL